MRPFMLSPLLLVAHALAAAPPAPVQGDTVCYSEQAILEHAETYPHSAFGWSVAIDGDTALVGDVTMDYDGAAYVFVRNGTTWTRQAKLQGWDNGYASDFGVSVAVQGDIAVVGDWTGGDNWYGAPGLAYVFTRSGTTWTPTSKLEANDGIEDDYFGVSVAISGDTIAVGADYANAVYVFVWNGLTWTQRAKLQIPSTNTPLFGSSVALNASPGGSTLIVGAPGWGPTGAGRAYAYVGNGATGRSRRNSWGPGRGRHGVSAGASRSPAIPR